MGWILRAGEVELAIAPTDENPRIVGALEDALPIRGAANRWGDEIYFTVPVVAEDESPRLDVVAGDVAYWAAGQALAVFFGRTPISVDERPRPIEPVNVVGLVEGPASSLKAVRDGADVELRFSG